MDEAVARACCRIAAVATISSEADVDASADHRGTIRRGGDRPGVPLALRHALHRAPALERSPDAALQPEAIDRRRRAERADAAEAHAGPLEAALLAVFGDVPGRLMLAGFAIIIAAGLYIFWREQAVGRPEQAFTPPP
jgi:hypothetical protein